MATENDVADFVAALETHFFPVKHDPPSRVTAWLASMFRDLRGYSSQVLDEAARDIIRNRKERYFPLPAECREACEAVKKRSDIASRASQLSATTWTYKRDDDYAPWRVQLADDLIRCDIGRQAVKEGWVLSLHDYARKHGKLPTQAEFHGLKQAAKEFDRAYTECVRGGWPQAAVLRDLGDKMIARREELSDMVQHGVVRG